MIALFCRYPELGQVKSRLAESCGAEKALKIYEKLLQLTLDNLSEYSKDVVLHYTAKKVGDLTKWLPGFNKIEQSDGSLGQRLIHALLNHFKVHDKPMVFIGADCIELNSRLIKGVYEALSEVDVVIAPASDGGYCLIAMNGPFVDLFENISWGSDVVCQQTLDVLYRKNISFKLLPQLNDIDYWDDLPESWKEEFR
jgi:uncharacterized protein